MSDTPVVYIDEDLEDLVPGFLENRHTDIQIMERLINDAEFDEIQRIGHSMKGSGGGYGFDEISRIGKKIEEAAQNGDTGKITTLVHSLKEYLDQVEIVYIEEE